MSKTVTKRADKVEKTLLDNMNKAHEQLMEANEKASERLSTLRDWDAPKFDGMPTAKESVERYYDFAGKVLEANRAFAEQIVTAWTAQPKKAAATKSTAKATTATTAARKTTARKTTARKTTARKTTAKK